MGVTIPGTAPGTAAEAGLSKGPFRAPRGDADFVQGMAAGGGAADAAESAPLD